MAEQQHRAGICCAPHAQHLRAAHVTDEQVGAVLISQQRIHPAWLALIDAVDLSLKADQGAQAGLPQPAETADQDHAGAGIHGPAQTPSTLARLLQPGFQARAKGVQSKAALRLSAAGQTIERQGRWQLL